ncbi:MAG: carbonic anhydrase [Sphingomicrobium sp.]
MTNLRLLIIGSIVAATAVPTLAGHQSHHWSYSGDEGPSHWAKLDAGNAACAAKSQSPIEIRTHDARATELPALHFNYRPVPLRIVDNGHTIQVNYDPGSSLLVGGKRYELVQFHFHRPSEEMVDGKRSAMVAHLVHRDAQGHLAVVAVPLRPSVENKLMETLWRNLPKVKEKELARTDVRINAASLLPAKLSYYAYSGSLTTPPCSEGVRWLVLKTPSSVSDREVGIFAARYPNNARPIQPRNGRQILSSK